MSVTLAGNPHDDEIALDGHTRFRVVPTRADLERFCFLDDADRRLIAQRRGDHNRLGFALQAVTVRYLGTFLADPLDVPTEVTAYVAGQLGIADPSCVKGYLAREKTRFEHQWVIAKEYGWRSFADAEDELSGWVADRAWVTGDGPRTILDAAAVWLRERQVLLPGVTTLARLVARVRDEALERLWETLGALPTAQQARQLELLLEVPEGSRASDLERLRKGPTTVSGKSMALALDRVAEIAALGLGGTDLSGVPRRRVVELARYGMAGKAPALRRRPYKRRLATLLATVVYLEAKAVDDALELFDVLMTNELLARALRESRDEKVRRYPSVSRDAGKLAVAGMVVSGTPRDSLHLIDLIYRQDGGQRPEVIIGDTGSYSDMVFGLLRLLGFDYRPQLADLPDAKLWRIDQTANYGAVAVAARGRVDLGKIRRNWPDILRLVASVHTGAVSAHDVIRMLSHGGSPTQLGDALAHYGRIFKTLHVLSYVDDVTYRRQIKAIRNLQEGRHDLARHLFHGGKGELRQAYREGMEDQLGALGLVLNCVTLWNTVYLDMALERLRAEGYAVGDADVARLSPYMRRHINVHGHYSFQLPNLPGSRRALRDPDATGEDSG